MPVESIVLQPEVDERQLGRETDAVNEELQDVARDIPVEFQGDMQGLQDGLEVPGGGGGGGGGVGAPPVPPGLLSKIPKPVAGVTAAAALPVALSGAVGLGMLNAMGNASARLQTSNKLFGVAVDNFFRAPGDLLDKTIVRPITNELLDFSLDFDELFREAPGGLPSLFTTGRNPREQSMAGIVGSNLGAGIFGALGLVTGGPGKAFSQSRKGAAIGEQFANQAVDQLNGISQDFQGWPEVRTEWPGWPKVDAEWPGWPNVPRLWPGWPDIDGLWPGWPDVSGLFPGWPDVMGLWPGWPSLNASEILNETFGVRLSGSDIVDSIGFPRLSPSNIVDELLGGGRGGPQVGSGNARGGVVNTSGVAQVHSGEMIGDERQLIEELSNAIDGSGGSGGGGSMDTTALENKLDRLHRDLKQLQSAFDVTLETDDETLARSTNNGRRNRLGDTDPTV